MCDWDPLLKLNFFGSYNFLSQQNARKVLNQFSWLYMFIYYKIHWKQILYFDFLYLKCHIKWHIVNQLIGKDLHISGYSLNFWIHFFLSLTDGFLWPARNSSTRPPTWPSVGKDERSPTLSISCFSIPFQVKTNDIWMLTISRCSPAECTNEWITPLCDTTSDKSYLFCVNLSLCPNQLWLLLLNILLVTWLLFFAVLGHIVSPRLKPHWTKALQMEYHL